MEQTFICAIRDLDNIFHHASTKNDISTMSKVLIAKEQLISIMKNYIK